MDGEAQQQQRDLALFAAMPDVTGQDYTELITRYPQLAEQLRGGWEASSPAQQRYDLMRVAEIFAMLHAGNPRFAMQLIHENVAFFRESGMEENAQHAETVAQMTANQPDAAMKMIGLTLASIMGSETFAAMFSTLDMWKRAEKLAPADVLASGLN